MRTTRRDFVRLTTAGAAASLAPFARPARSAAQAPPTATTHAALYTNLLQTWCDGLLTHQVSAITDPALHGAFLCPSCAIVHGRCADAVYPLLRVARTTGDPRYLLAARNVYDWSERQVSRQDGSWINDVFLSSWKGITVFRTIALAEALLHHGELLDATTRAAWTARLDKAMQFLDGFITMETGNINYPVTSSLSFALAGQLLSNRHYLDRAHQLAHASLDRFTPAGFLFGEGHPVDGVSPRHCRPVDLGYNVEESLPALALYAVLTNDDAIQQRAVTSLRTHLEFMLPDGAWDNSWGTRNYKWSWWGSRTSDGCQPGFVLLSSHDPRFLEAARRNTELMQRCTHAGLLYGGPDYLTHGDLPCIHHTFTHAKALATVLDRAEHLLDSGEHLLESASPAREAARPTLPRETAYGLKSYPEIATHLASIGDWRATVTAYDFQYAELSQINSPTLGGGHATGGALTLLFHQHLGPLLTASLTEYQIFEISNQQTFGDAPHMTLTPRVEIPTTGPHAFTSLNDLQAQLTAAPTPGRITFEATGRLQTAQHRSVPTGDVLYHLTYTLTPAGVDITVRIEGDPGPVPATFILPVISRANEPTHLSDPATLDLTKPAGTLRIHTDAPTGFQSFSPTRTFNLVPGFECLPLTIALTPGTATTVRISTPS